MAKFKAEIVLLAVSTQKSAKKSLCVKQHLSCLYMENKKTVLLLFVNTCVKQTVHIVNAAFIFASTVLTHENGKTVKSIFLLTITDWHYGLRLESAKLKIPLAKDRFLAQLYMISLLDYNFFIN
ncbi:hypothetical protein T01_6344 [Trichinella spiralis]|uniref:Uncharacterized protein n=1 Tax=Trichinella spiralis TaxID=6334 RepID=A0A0V1BYQ5_TRISP|nr:hypothetical protein T01_6344 [Trichinella spiralis]